MSNSQSLRRDVFKRHLVMGLCRLVLFHVNVTGAWLLIMMRWIFESEILDITELLVRKKSVCEYEW